MAVLHGYVHRDGRCWQTTRTADAGRPLDSVRHSRSEVLVFTGGASVGKTALLTALCPVANGFRVNRHRPAADDHRWAGVGYVRVITDTSSDDSDSRDVAYSEQPRRIYRHQPIVVRPVVP
jgi:hypothetical protein